MKLQTSHFSSFASTGLYSKATIWPFDMVSCIWRKQGRRIRGIKSNRRQKEANGLYFLQSTSSILNNWLDTFIMGLQACKHCCYFFLLFMQVFSRLFLNDTENIFFCFLIFTSCRNSAGSIAPASHLNIQYILLEVYNKVVRVHKSTITSGLQKSNFFYHLVS